MKYLLLAVFAAVAVIMVSSQNTTSTDATVITDIISTEIGSTALTTMETTTAMVTTTAMPTTQAPPFWMVKDSSGNACIMADLDAMMFVHYTKTDNSTGNATLGLTEKATVNTDNSHCGNETEPAVLVLNFGEKNSIRHEFTLAEKSYSLTKVEASLEHDTANFPNSTDQGNIVTYQGKPTEAVFQSSEETSYRCNSPQFFQLNETLWNVTYSDVKVQPFGVKDNKFSEENVCAADMTTTPMPVTTVMPPAGDWTFDDGNGTCLNMSFSAKFSIKYINEAMKQNTSEVDLPQAADATNSFCNHTDANFTLTFFDVWSLSMIFHRANNKSSETFTVTSYALTYQLDGQRFLNPLEKDQIFTVSTTKTGIEADNGKYYKCDSVSKVKAGNTTSNFMDMKLQPFARDNNGAQGTGYTECAADSEISNIVPIAVGCALAGLVIIVLIAYLIGRSRSSRQGYQSV